MSEFKRRWLGNASANVAGGVITTLFNLMLPALLARHLESTDFAVWNLALQVVVYIQVFSAGLQSAVGRFVAIGNERNDLVDQVETIGAAVRVALFSVGIASLAVIFLTWWYPLLFKGIPVEKIFEFRVCVLWMGFSSAVQLFAQLPAGIYMGRHKNYIWMLCQASVRIATLGAVYFLSIINAELTQYSTWYAVVGLVILPLSILTIYRVFPELTARVEYSRDRFRKMAAYCASLSIWGVSTLMVSGLSIAMVGYFDFGKVSAYALAASLINVMLGLLGAVMSPMIANFAALHAVETMRIKLPVLLVYVTRVMVIALFLGVFLAVFLGFSFLQLWVGSAYASAAYPLLIALAFSAAIRNLCLPYSMLILAIGAPRDATTGVLLEGLVSLLASLLLGMKYGALGVALGSICASIIGVAYNGVFLYPKVDYFGDIRKYVSREIMIPLAVILAALLIYLYINGSMM